jgi:hypothetical protein
VAHVVGHHSSGCGGACGHHEGAAGASTRAPIEPARALSQLRCSGMIWRWSADSRADLVLTTLRQNPACGPYRASLGRWLAPLWRQVSPNEGTPSARAHPCVCVLPQVAAHGEVPSLGPSQQVLRLLIVRFTHAADLYE